MNKGTVKVPEWLREAIREESKKADMFVVGHSLKPGAVHVDYVARALGASANHVYWIMKNDRMDKELLDELDRNYHGRERGTMRVRMENIISPRFATRQAKQVLTYLRTVARIVQDYRKALKLTDNMYRYYVFPPKSVIRGMAMAIDHAYKVLLKIHKECPEYDALLLADAPLLQEEFNAMDGARTKPADNQHVQASGSGDSATEEH